ncbi:MAG: ThiF family adenylyltransferase [Woeseiaceae bacterium]|nr:ThiF family adenylyltransferase [Woeseiaceae bacterium]
MPSPHALKRLVFPTSGHEGMAYVVCGVAEVNDGDEIHHRYLSHAVVEVPGQHIQSSSSSHISVDTTPVANILRRARDEHLTVLVVHSHRPGPAIFSPQDDADEPKLIELAQHRNGDKTHLLSMILAETGDMTARIWLSPDRYQMLDRISVVGSRLLPSTHERIGPVDHDLYARQILALGHQFQSVLSKLVVGIVGAGATGSATAMLLARLGVKNFVLIDDDTVEKSNLNRLHSAAATDAEMQKPKVEALENFVKSIQPGICSKIFVGLVDDPDCRDALRSCDVVFGCTDDHGGRIFLNRLAYFYLIPVFDMGIGIDYEGGEVPRIVDAAARVTTLFPGNPCLICRGVVDPFVAREEALQRQNPEEYQRQAGEAYVRGGGVPNPAVVSFTTEVACMAVDELIERLTGYRQVGPISHRVRKYRLAEDKYPGLADDERDCPICISQQYWGRGDVRPFMDRIGG